MITFKIQGIVEAPIGYQIKQNRNVLASKLRPVKTFQKIITPCHTDFNSRNG